MAQAGRTMHGSPGKSERPEKIADLGWSEWKRVFSQTRRRMKRHDAPITAAAVAFQATLALIAGLTVLIIGYLKLTGGGLVTGWLSGSNSVIPDQVRELLRDQVDQVLSASGPGLWIALLLALAFSLFSARNGIVALIHGLNRAFEVEETRSGGTYVVQTLLIAVGAGIFVLLLLGLIVAGGPLVSSLGLSDTLESLALAGRWIVLMLLVMTAISVLYRYGPDRRDPDFRFATVGSLLGTLIWVLSSLVFAWYVESAGTYDKIYGTLGSIVILMIWLYISAFVLLIGAELRLRNGVRRKEMQG